MDSQTPQAPGQDPTNNLSTADADAAAFLQIEAIEAEGTTSPHAPAVSDNTLGATPPEAVTQAPIAATQTPLSALGSSDEPIPMPNFFGGDVAPVSAPKPAPAPTPEPVKTVEIEEVASPNLESTAAPAPEAAVAPAPVELTNPATPATAEEPAIPTAPAVPTQPQVQPQTPAAKPAKGPISTGALIGIFVLVVALGVGSGYLIWTYL